MKTIWELCFGDDREPVDGFYDICFSPEECYISKKHDTVLAVLHMIKCSVEAGGRKYDAVYMYAACTHPDYQGMGVMSELIEKAVESEKAKGVQLVLCVPANDELFGFYKRFGFDDGIYCSSFTFGRNELEGLSTECDYRLNPDSLYFNSKRNELLEKSGKAFVRFEDKYTELAENFGYSTVTANNSYAVFSENDGVVIISDCFYVKNGFNELCYALLNETGSDKYVFDSADDDILILKGVIRKLDKNLKLDEKIYLGIKME